ncbi:MAG: DUF5664 domain-containing protein [Proteobacteria bacterium]|nr:DUF5664 domain-containing protein [Pseudomonadota bacterium]
MQKFDEGKSPLMKGALHSFPKALEQVALLSRIGASKYTWFGWRDVEGGVERYSDAMVRHIAAEEYEDADPETGMPHAVHAAWNALARLELMIRGETCQTRTEQPHTNTLNFCNEVVSNNALLRHALE